MVVALAVLVTCCALIFTALSHRTNIANRWTALTGILLLLTAGTVSAALRPVKTPSDMENYLLEFHRSPAQSLPEALSTSKMDVGYVTAAWALGQVTQSAVVYKAGIWLTIALLVYIAARRVLSRPHAFVLLFAYTCYVPFMSYSTNALRQGVALGFLLICFAEACRMEAGSRRLLIFTGIAAAVFHISAIVPVALILAIRWWKPAIRVAVACWLVAALCSVTHVNGLLLGRLIDLLGDFSIYGGDGLAYVYTGGTNRLDFVVASGILALVIAAAGWFVDAPLEQRRVLLTGYLFVNIFFLALGFVTFSDRLASYSWFLVPLCLAVHVLGTERMLWPRVVRTGFVLGFLVTGLATGSVAFMSTW